MSQSSFKRVPKSLSFDKVERASLVNSSIFFFKLSKMSGLLVVPMKKAYEVDISGPLKNLISHSYNGNNASAVDHTDAINELNKLRNSALIRTSIKIESLEKLYKYEKPV